MEKTVLLFNTLPEEVFRQDFVGSNHKFFTHVNSRNIGSWIYFVVSHCRMVCNDDLAVCSE